MVAYLEWLFLGYCILKGVDVWRVTSFAPSATTSHISFQPPTFGPRLSDCFYGSFSNYPWTALGTLELYRFLFSNYDSTACQVSSPHEDRPCSAIESNRRFASANDEHSFRFILFPSMSIVLILTSHGLKYYSLVVRASYGGSNLPEHWGEKCSLSTRLLA